MVCHVPPEVVIEHAGRFPEAYGELSGCEICALPHYEENLFLFQICLSYKYIYIYNTCRTKLAEQSEFTHHGWPYVSKL